MNIMNEIYPYSPRADRDFIWVAEYLDGNILYEIDRNNIQHQFNEINKQLLLRFGLIGHGCRLFFDTLTGVFNIIGNQYKFIYKTDNNVYNLNEQNIRYNDIINYYSCFSDFVPSGTSNSVVYQYNIGYKCQLQINNIKFSFKPILHIPLNKPVFMTIKIYSESDLDGWLEIHRNNFKCADIKAPLNREYGQNIYWQVDV